MDIFAKLFMEQTHLKGVCVCAWIMEPYFCPVCPPLQDRCASAAGRGLWEMGVEWPGGEGSFPPNPSADSWRAATGVASGNARCPASTRPQQTMLMGLSEISRSSQR